MTQASPAATVYCSRCGTPAAGDAAFCARCGAPLATAAVPPSAPPSAVSEDAIPVAQAPRYAGFWMRCLAYLIDLVPCYLLGKVSGLLAVPLAVAVGLAAGVQSRDAGYALGFAIGYTCAVVAQGLYFAGMESQWGGSVGKLALGMRVVDLEGRRIGFGRATGRYLAKLLSALPLGAGFVMVGVSETKQGLHDRIAGTRVLMR